jgi:PPOX class probable F420-dependent enzyme
MEVKGYFAPLTTSKYMLLTTFRRTGEPVSTPVHVVAEGDVAFFRTWDVSGKGKRLRHTASVKVAPCRFRGRRLGDDLPAVAVVLGDEASCQAAAKLARAHPLLHGRLIPWYHRRRGWTTQQYRLQHP